MDFVIIRYLHFIGILVLSSALVLEHMLLRREATVADIKKLAVIDLIYGVSAGLVLLTGLAMWFWVGKPAEFYSANPLFHSKLLLFVFIALMSIYPTLFFIRSRRSGGSVAVPRIIVATVRIELLLLAAIPLLAVLMAQGYGLG
jgi:putative membrane protein